MVFRHKRAQPEKLFDVECDWLNFRITPKEGGDGFRMSKWGEVRWDSVGYGETKRGSGEVSGPEAEKALAAARAFVDEKLAEPEYSTNEVRKEASEWAAGSIRSIGRHDILQWRDAFEGAATRIEVDEVKQADNLVQFLSMEAVEGVDYPLHHRKYLMSIATLRAVQLAVQNLGYAQNKLTLGMGMVALREIRKKMAPEEVRAEEHKNPENFISDYDMLNYSRQDYHSGGF